MASAAGFIANATITLDLPTAGTQEDVLGNITPQTEQVTQIAYVYKGPRSSDGRAATANRFEPFPGVDVNENRFGAYATEPQKMDARIIEGVRGTCQWDGRTWTAQILSVGGKYGRTGYIGETLQGIIGDKFVLELLDQL